MSYGRFHNHWNATKSKFTVEATGLRCFAEMNEASNNDLSAKFSNLGSIPMSSKVDYP